MARRMSVREARAKFSEMLGSVHFTNNPVIVERNGKPYAVVISPKDFERLIEHSWEAVDRIRERNKDVDPDEAYEFITSVVEEVRRERREQREQQRERAQQESDIARRA